MPHRKFYPFFLFNLRQPARPICGLMLLYRSISLVLYIVSPYRASVAARTPFSARYKQIGSQVPIWHRLLPLLLSLSSIICFSGRLFPRQKRWPFARLAPPAPLLLPLGMIICSTGRPPPRPKGSCFPILAPSFSPL